MAIKYGIKKPSLYVSSKPVIIGTPLTDSFNKPVGSLPLSNEPSCEIQKENFQNFSPSAVVKEIGSVISCGFALRLAHCSIVSKLRC